MIKLVVPNEYFDEIFCINLPRATERWSSVSERLKREQIYVTRFEGIDKKNLQTDFNHFLARNPHTAMNRLGRYAIWRTYSRLFEHILTLNIKNFLILEDDILFHKDFKYLFDNAVKKIPNWDMWYLGSTQVNWVNLKQNEIQDFYKPNGSTYGMMGVGMKKDFLEKNYSRYSRGNKNNDAFFATDIDFTNVFVSYPQLIGHAEGFSYNAEYMIDKTVTEKRAFLKYDSAIYI